MFQAFLGPIASLASTFMEGRNEKIKANTRVKIATAEAEAKVMEDLGLTFILSPNIS